jgi:Protein of unknown function (DUF3592)
LGNFIFVAGIGTLLVLAGLVVFRSARRGLGDDLASRDWPHVEGQIVKAGNIPSYGVNIRSYYVNYEYEIAGVKHKGSEVLGTGNEEADPLVLKFPAGAKAQIYYNPDTPSIARLRPGFTRRSNAIAWGYMLGFVCLGLLLIGLAFLPSWAP